MTTDPETVERVARAYGEYRDAPYSGRLWGAMDESRRAVYRDDVAVFLAAIDRAGYRLVAADDATDLRATVEDLVRQFAYPVVADGVPSLTTGGLSALEGAFAVLGWSDPYPLETAE